ncbi:putative uncharacterized protein DDB_G0294196 [Acanthaster planci]|uniref:Uncharacterized protein n=1 Tax=Acanthaster planci TaxID=133434 RepID=A0A8B8A135_ACAPL|nr:putative uncharacterized protein DDB_G0294196 [Acanthaster planci]
MGPYSMLMIFIFMVTSSQNHGTVYVDGARDPGLSVSVQRKQHEMSHLSIDKHFGSSSDIGKILKLLMALEVATTRLEQIQAELDEKITGIEQKLLVLESPPGRLPSNEMLGEVVVSTDLMQVSDAMGHIAAPSVPDRGGGAGLSTQTVPIDLVHQNPGFYTEQQQQKPTQPPQTQQDIRTQPLQTQQDLEDPQSQPSLPRSQPSHQDQELEKESPLQQPSSLQQQRQGTAGNKLDEIDQIIELASGLKRRHDEAPPSNQMRSSGWSPPVWKDDRRARIPPIVEALARQGKMVEREGLPWLSLK